MTCNDCKPIYTNRSDEMSAGALEAGAWSEYLGIELCPRHAALEDRLKELERQLQDQSSFNAAFADKLKDVGTIDRLVEEYSRYKQQVRDLEQRVTVLDAGWATCSLVYKESQKEVDRLTVELREAAELLQAADVCGEIGEACPWCHARSYDQLVEAQHTETCGYQQWLTRYGRKG